MSSRGFTQTYYEILEIPMSAQQHEIVAAYQKAKEAYAADSPALYTMFTRDEAIELRKLVDEAYLILGNQSKRREYDQSITNRRQQADVNALPDFLLEQPLAPRKESRATPPSPSQPTPPQQQTIATNTVPEGFAKSRLSIYEVKPEVEAEIIQQTTFDGPFLRKIRQYKNINIEQLSKETRISRTYLAALESDDMDALPAPVFTRGFVVQVARILGLNEAVVANSYMDNSKKKA